MTKRIRAFLLLLLVVLSTLSISACNGNGGDGCDPPRHWVKKYIHSNDGSSDFEYQVCE